MPTNKDQLPDNLVVGDPSGDDASITQLRTDEIERLLSLLKEYTVRITDSRVSALKAEYVLRMLPTAKKLAQFASQRISRAPSDLLRMELELRLAEYESALSLVSK